MKANWRAMTESKAADKFTEKLMTSTILKIIVVNVKYEFKVLTCWWIYQYDIFDVCRVDFCECKLLLILIYH